MRIMRLYFDLCYEEYSLFYDYGKIEKKLWKDWKEGIEASLSKNAFQNAWVIIHKDTTYSDSFDEFIEKIISNFE